MEKNTFYNYDFKATLYVPCEALDAYKTDSTWGKFNNIQCIASPSDPCEDIVELDWRVGIRLSMLTAGWYKLYVGDIHANKSAFTIQFINDLACPATMNRAYYANCEDSEAIIEGSVRYELGETIQTMSYADFADIVAPHIDYLYLNIASIVEDCQKDTIIENITDWVCDGGTYKDILGEEHVISSYVPDTHTWSNTIETDTTITIYNYTITPIVPPTIMTNELLATIPGATPVLIAGKKVDVTGTLEAIKNYYYMNDTEAFADVESVVWATGADVTLACDAESHTMILNLTAGCDLELNAELVFEVPPIEVMTTTETAVICEGETYQWQGISCSETGSYTFEVKNEEGCVVEIKVLELTVIPAEIVTTADTATICEGETYTWNVNGKIYENLAAGIYNYADTIEGICSRVIATLTLNVNASITKDINITACDSYTWNGQTYTQSGEYVYTTVAANGCDSIVTLHLTIYKSEYIEETVAACDSYTWNGETYTTSGDYTYTTTAANGCDSIVTLHLTINNSEVGETKYATICHGETYTWNGQTYSTAGEYSITLSNTFGCDSVTTLHLAIMPEAVSTTETVVIGSNELPYTWRGQSITATGRYTDIEQYTTAACDSAIHVLDLTVLTTGNHDEQSVTICEKEAPYTWYGESYSVTGKYTFTEQYVGTDIDSIQHILNLTVNPTVYTEEHITTCDSYEWNGQTYSTTGAYTYTTTASNGCDSIVTLHLTVNHTQYAEETITTCDSYTWNGETYTQSGDYVYTTIAANGCDSIVTLHLTIYKSEYIEETVTSCDSYEWNGQTYTESGDYTYTITTDQGCEHIEVLHLTIYKSEYIEETITACDSYAWNGQTYTESGDYTYTTTTEQDCERVEVLHLTIHQTQYAEEHITACDSYTWNGQTYTQSGTHTYTTIAANGCDSIVTLHLIINNSVVGEIEYATICYGETYTWNGQSYSTTGEYSITLSNALGCDSVATLLLTILPEAVTLEESVTLNEEQLPYIWRGQSCDHAGVYTISIPFANYPYCDSVIYALNLTVEAPNKCGDHLYWHYSNNTMTITGSGDMYDDPDLLSYRQQPWYPERVSHVILPNAITHIGNVAFADCANLTHIDIPNSVTSLGDGAFSWTGLQYVTIPIGVTTIGEQVFETCNNLRTILYEGNPTTINNKTVHPLIGCVHLDTIITPAALWHCTTADPALETRYGVPNKARYIEITNGELTKQAMAYIAKNRGTMQVLDLSAATNTTLPLGALMNSYRLSNLYLPEQIRTIPEMLAEGCHSLTEIIIPATVIEIGNYAFAGCTNVWQMTVDAVVPPTVYAETFKDIDRNISVIVPAGSEEAYRQAAYWQEFFIKDTNSPSPITNCQKILREDQILILRNGNIYTTMGQLINVGE